VRSLIVWWQAAPRRRTAIATLAAACALGAILTIAGVSDVLIGALTLCFLLIAPTVAIGGLLPALDPAARWIVAGGAAVAVLGLTAQSMLWLSAWSPRHGVAAIALACAVLLALPPTVRRLRARPDGAPSDDTISGYMPGSTDPTAPDPPAGG
jgi:hypothetical protein